MCGVIASLDGWDNGSEFMNVGGWLQVEGGSLNVKMLMRILLTYLIWGKEHL